jgi:protein-S-isoprenylcysteine O-methyltransferase Ste14
VRIAWVIVTLLTSAVPMAVIYLLLAAILPAAPSTVGTGDQEPVDPLREPSASQDSGRPDWPIVFGILLLAVGGMLLIAQYLALDWEVLWPVSLIALGIAIVVIAVRPGFGGRR